MFNRWKPAILVYAVLLFIVGTALFHKLGEDDSFSPSSIFNDNAAAAATQEGPDFWEWETKTRFSSGSNEEERICDSFPSHILSQVQVILKIGASESPDRLEAQISTVTRCISNLLVVSDMESELHGHRVHDVLADLPESVWTNKADLDAYQALKRGNTKAVNGQQGWNLDRMKFLPMVERAYDVNPTAKWYVFLESDTYYVWDNVFRLLDQYDPTVPLYFGSPSPGKPTAEETTWFAYGGSGFIISAAAMRKLVHRKTGAYGEYIQPSLSAQYEDIIRGTDCGDTVIGWALYEKGVKLSGLWPMFNAHALHSIPFDEMHWCRPVISMHKTKLADMEGLTKWENGRDRTVCIPPLTVIFVIANEKHAYSTPCCTPTSSTTPEWEHPTNDPTGTTQTGEGGKNPPSHQLTLHSRLAVKPAMTMQTVSRTLTVHPGIASLPDPCGWEIRGRSIPKIVKQLDGTWRRCRDGGRVTDARERSG